MFIDEVKVYARAGHGGRGCVAFHREAFITKGGPSGGNGGRGGDVILEADHDLNNLIHQFYTPRLVAKNGEHGMGRGMDGHAGDDLVVKVPCGTLVWRLKDETNALAGTALSEAEASDEDADTASKESPLLAASRSERPVIRHSGGITAVEYNFEDDEPKPEASTPRRAEDAELVVDMTTHGQRFVLCKGGRGGLGNRNFATARRQTPRFAQPGEPGLEGNYLFELRLMAEAGLIGYPNAGKSTLLTAISAAHPKVAPYPFTTLKPQVGIVRYADFHRITVCDVPGLIEGAHENAGLGHAFLRHIQRCKILVFLLDMAGTDNREPWDDYRKLLAELELYDPALLEKPRMVVANKMDEPQAVENLKKFKRRVPKTRVLQMAAAFDEGIESFKDALRDAVQAAS